MGLRPRRPGPAGGPAGGLARLPLPEAGGQRQLHPPLRLGQEDTWIHFRAGSLGGGHGHADLLHVDVYHGGEAVLTDAGRGTYVDGGLRRA